MLPTKLPLALWTILALSATHTPMMAQGIKSLTDTIAVITVNDFHASFLPYPNQGIPGAGHLWATIDSLRHRYPSHIVVSAGDNFGGSYFSRKTNDAWVPWFFERLGITLSAIGNHEFDNGQVFLADRWQSEPQRPKGWHIDYVCANVTDSTGQPPHYMQRVATRHVPLAGGDSISIAFTGLVTATTPYQTSQKHIKGLHFRGDYAQVLRELHQEPAVQTAFTQSPIRILNTHIATEMHGTTPTWTEKGDDKAFEGIESLGYHAIITGHSHFVVEGRLHHLPTIQAECYGKHVGLLTFVYHRQTKHIEALPARAILVGTSQWAHQERDAIDAKMDSILNATTNDQGRSLGQILTQATDRLEHDRKDKRIITPLAGYICRSYADAAREALQLQASTIVIGLSHTAGIRTHLQQGKVRTIDAGQVLPFDNKVALFRMPGHVLKSLLEFGLNNRTYGWLQSADLIIEATEHHSTASTTADEWPHYTLKQVTYTNGHITHIIADSVDYYVAADNFMTLGGDSYPTAYFAPYRIEANTPVTSEAFFRYLQGQQSISIKHSPYSHVRVSR